MVTPRQDREIHLNNLTFHFFSNVRNKSNNIIQDSEYDQFLKDLLKVLNPEDEDRTGFVGKTLSTQLVNVQDIRINLEDRPHLYRLYQILDILEVSTDKTVYNERNPNVVKEKKLYLNNICLIQPNLLMIQGAEETSSYIMTKLEEMSDKYSFSQDQVLYSKKFLLWLLAKFMEDQENVERELPFEFYGCSRLYLTHPRQKVIRPEIDLKENDQIQSTLMGSLAILSGFLPTASKLKVLTEEGDIIEFELSISGVVNLLMSSGSLANECNLKRILMGVQVILKIRNFFNEWQKKHSHKENNSHLNDVLSEITQERLAINIVQPLLNLLNRYFSGHFSLDENKLLKFHR